jgi:serine/threonine-protein kinase
MLHERGERDRALAIFDTMRAAIPPDWHATTDDAIALERYARCLVAEGRANEAVPLLRGIEERQLHGGMWPEDLRRARLTLGNALAASGDLAGAQRSLRLALDDYVAAEPAATPDGLEARRSMASVLIDDMAREPAMPNDPRRTEALHLLQAVAQAPAPLRNLTAEPALALAEQARLALQAGDDTEALRRLDTAQQAFDAVTGLKDVHGRERIARLRAQASDAAARRSSKT